MTSKTFDLTEAKTYKVFLNNPDFNITYNIYSGATLELKELFYQDIKQNIVVNLLGENASFIASFLSISNHSNIHISQDIYHKAKKTSSDVKNYAFSNFGNTKYNTTSSIDNGMKKSNAKQLTKGIILNDKSLISSKPILNISENDVFASHGCAIGKIREEELFYLMSRGLTRQEAVLLITKGIIEPFFENIDEEELKIKVYNIIQGSTNE